MTNITISNLKPVSEFASYIKERIQNQTKNWWEIAEAFAEAREMYGFESDSFKKLCLDTKFSKSKASKLATIAQSERLKTYGSKLSAVHSWGTLYAITTLDEVQFQELKQVLALDNPNKPAPFITQAEVERYKRKKFERSFFKNYAVIQIDEEALKGELLTGDDCEALNELIEKIEALTSYVKVRHMKLDEKDASNYMIRLEQKAQQLVRQQFYESVMSKLSGKKRPKHEPQESFESRILGMSRRELNLKLNDSPKEAFEYLGLEYDESKFYSEAQSALSKTAERFAKKVLDRLSTISASQAEFAKAA